MIDVKSPEDRSLVESVYRAEQDHVFLWWGELSEVSRRKLLDQLRIVDFEQLEQLKTLIASSHDPQPLGRIEPPEIIPIPEQSGKIQRAQIRARTRAHKRGEDFIREGKLGVLLVAGGQGTRLGFDGPKGAFPIGPVTQKTLFGWHAEKILAASRNYGVSIPWFIMTSATNDDETRAHFEANRYYGFPPEAVFFFRQRMMPALDGQGKLIMDTKDHFFESPNGHGGSILALKESGALSRMKANGIEAISYFQVDNVLIRIIDPVFTGYHLEAGAQMSSKMVRKTDPHEKVGLFCHEGGKLRVVEYSELTDEDMHKRRPDGTLMYDAGSIAIHMIDTAFAEFEADPFRLPFHVAHKKIPFIDANGRMQKPAEANGYKFETFVFDALDDAERSVVMEISRSEEYSPVKSATGEDSPETARRDLSRLFATWLEDAGVAVERTATGDVAGAIEISPLFAADREAFLAKCPRDLKFEGELVLSSS